MKAYNKYETGKINCKNNPAGLIYAVTTNDCPCASGTGYNSQTCLCDPCMDRLVGCILCPSLALCSQCDTTQNFELSAGACVCISGYVINNRSCVPVCGDGVVLSIEACDDGNTVNGDGCSDECKVEVNYTCTRPLNSPSVCGYNQPLLGDIQSIVKDPERNSVTLFIQLDPHFPGISQLNFSQLFSPNFASSNVSFRLSTDGML